MPLPPEIDTKIQNQFEKLIGGAEAFIPQMKEATSEYFHDDDAPVFVSEFSALRSQSVNLIRLMFGSQAAGLDHLRRVEGLNHSVSSAQAVLGILKGWRDDYSSGMLETLEVLIHANLAADYMGQAEELLEEGKRSVIGHLPAAVLCGAVLEDALRQLCGRQTPPVATKKPNGQPKRLNALIDDLQNASIYNPLKGNQLRTWAKVRNHAAHGEDSEFDKNDVEDMLRGVKNFLADYL